MAISKTALGGPGASAPPTAHTGWQSTSGYVQKNHTYSSDFLERWSYGDEFPEFIYLVQACAVKLGLGSFHTPVVVHSLPHSVLWLNFGLPLPIYSH